MKKHNFITLVALLLLAFGANAQVTTFPFTEGFEGTTFPPANWTQDTVSGTSGWTSLNGNQNALAAKTGSLNAIFYAGNYNGHTAKLITPAMNISSLTNPRLIFEHTQEDWSGDQDSLRVYYRTSATGAWTLLVSYTSSVSSWTERTISLPNASANYYIAFEAYADYGYGVTIDDFKVEATPSCLAPSLPLASSIATDSANLAWTENGTATSWQIEWDTANFVQGTGNLVITGSNPYALTSLTANTAYDYYVRAICTAGDTSAWSAKESFTTNCNAFAIPYTEGFENGYTHNTALAGCLSQESATGNQVWTVNNTFTDYNRTPRTGNWNAFLQYGNNDWIFIPVDLTSGTSYTAEVWANQDGNTLTNSNVGIRYGTAANAAAMTDTIVANTGIDNSPKLITGSFTPTASGVYYIGINGFMNGNPWYISIDDIAIITTPSCLAPTLPLASSIATDSANLAWTENGTATSWQIEWDTANFVQGTGNLVITGSNPYALTSLTANTAYDYYVRAICAAGDTSAWSAKESFTTNCNTFAIPYTEGFENGYTHNTALAGCLSQESAAGNQVWTVNNTFTNYNRTPRTGNWNAFLQYGNNDWIFIPVDLTSGTSYTAEVWANQDGNTLTNSNVGIRYGTAANAAAMTDTIVANTGIDNSPKLITGSFTPTASGVYYIGINGFMNGNPWFISIDDIAVIETPSCLAPTLPLASSIATDSANLAWTENGTATSWQIEWDTANFVQGTGNLVITGSNPYALTSLTANTAYDYYVRAICTAGDTSAWSAKESFTTNCNAFAIPYTEGFENGYTHNTALAGCLSQESITGAQTWTVNNTFTNRNRTPRTGNWNAFLQYSNNDWIYIPVNLMSGTTYTAEVWANQDGTTTTNSNVGIRYGTAANAAAMTETVAINTGIDATPKLIRGSFSPTASGVYYIGINGFMNGSPWYISIDDIAISECTPTSGTDVQTACDSFTWTNGLTYMTSNNSALDTLINEAGCDSVVTLNLTILNSNTGTDVQTACNSFTWTDGVTYTSSNNTALDTLMNAAGCDSIVTLNLTILNSTMGTDVQTACNSFSWTDGMTYTMSNNTALDTFMNAAGCDSIVTLDLTILNSTMGTDVQTACNSFTWTDGMTYTMSNNTALDTFMNAAGCDSIVTLDLTILNSNTGTDVQTACNSFTWTDGVTYTMSNNTALDTLMNAAGCDSIVTLNLTILNSNTGTDVQTACNSFTWTDGMTYTMSNNTALDTFMNAAGCDSVVTLDLTILNSTMGTDVQTACNSFTWTDGMTYTMSNNTALDTFMNAAGCDSVVTLNLTILNSNTGTDVQTACNSFTWTDGMTYTMSNNTALDTFMNAAGCDSVVTLDLTILNSTMGTDVQTACNSFTWTDEVTYTISNNTALDTFMNAAGCDSIVTLDLTIISNDLTITNNDPVLDAVEQTGATYQWLNCQDNFSRIDGATDASFSARTNNDYAVEITNSICIDTSICTSITLASVLENTRFEGVSIYPNPSTGLVNIDLSSLEVVSINVYDVNGAIIYTEDEVSTDLFQFNLEAAKGIYIVEINTDTQTMRTRLIKR